MLATLHRHEEAHEFALLGYRQAWCDGPPYCRRRDLDEAAALLADLGVAVPVLAVTDPATVVVPLEREVRDSIASLHAAE